MTGLARRAHTALVHIVVTGDALGLGRQKRPLLVAGRAAPGDVRMLAVKRETGDTRVVEGRGIEGTKVGIDAGVLGVARLARSLDIFVDTDMPGHAVGHWLVTGQTFGRRHLLALFVTLLAVREPFEIRMRLGEAARGQEAAELCLCRRERRQPRETGE